MEKSMNMTTDVTSVIETARDFIQKAGYQYSKVTKVIEKEGKWIVIVNVGALLDEFKTITIDANTGKVISYE